MILLIEDCILQRISEKFFYGSIDLCHCIVGRGKCWNQESGTLVEDLLDEVRGSFWGVWRQFLVGIMLHVGICRSWLCSRDSFILGSAVLVVMSSIFPVERHAFSSFWLMIFNIIWTITFLSYPPSFSVSLCLSLSQTHHSIHTLPIFSGITNFSGIRAHLLTLPMPPQLGSPLGLQTSLCRF